MVQRPMNDIRIAQNTYNTKYVQYMVYFRKDTYTACIVYIAQQLFKFPNNLNF